MLTTRSNEVFTYDLHSYKPLANIVVENGHCFYFSPADMTSSKATRTLFIAGNDNSYEYSESYVAGENFIILAIETSGRVVKRWSTYHQIFGLSMTLKVYGKEQLLVSCGSRLLCYDIKTGKQDKIIILAAGLFVKQLSVIHDHIYIVCDENKAKVCSVDNRGTITGRYYVCMEPSSVASGIFYDEVDEKPKEMNLLYENPKEMNWLSVGYFSGRQTLLILDKNANKILAMKLPSLDCRQLPLDNNFTAPNRLWFDESTKKLLIGCDNNRLLIYRMK